ncbi:MAG: lysine exporter LysO family protein [Firmicutes bacterium]|nr:lysine exporter LysO family protein [Bacillota bacterium]
MSSILLYLALLIVGGFLSYKGWIHQGLSNKIDKLQLACLFVLLFVMGLRIGMDDRVLDAFAQIGLHAILFGIFTIIGSVLTVHLMLKVFNRKAVK